MQTYVAQAVVISKTKLSETDLIITFLDNKGCQLRAVAKGARKPSSASAARLEICNTVEILCVKGRNLDIIKEVRLLDSRPRIRTSLEVSTMTLAALDVLAHCIQDDLENEKVFALTQTYLDAQNSSEGSTYALFTLAYILKLFAFIGIAPQLLNCVICSEEAPRNADAEMRISSQEGGYICSTCYSSTVDIHLQGSQFEWLIAALYGRFDDLSAEEIDVSLAFVLLDVCRTWAHVHIAPKIKAFEYIFTCGYFEN